MYIFRVIFFTKFKIQQIKTKIIQSYMINDTILFVVKQINIKIGLNSNIQQGNLYIKIRRLSYVTAGKSLD